MARVAHWAMLLLTLSFLGVEASLANDAALKAGVFSPARAAPAFSLRGSDGVELKLSRYRGKVVLLAFGYTSCADVCPITLAVLAQARKKLDAENKDVRVIYITVDPERDDVERMRKYLAAFDSTFIGGTGTAAQLSTIYQSYGIAAAKQAASGGYAVAHSSYVYLIDRGGKLRALMPFGRTADDYVHDIKLLLKE